MHVVSPYRVTGTWGKFSGPGRVEPAPIPDPARLIVPSRFQSSDESSPGQEGSKNTSAPGGSKKTSKKTKKHAKKSKKDDEADASDEHQPLPGGQDDDDDMDDLDGMEELLNLQGDDDEKPRKRQPKKRPASDKNASKKRPAKKCDEPDVDNLCQKAGLSYLQCSGSRYMLSSLSLKVHHFPCEALPFQHMIEGLPDDLLPDFRPIPMEI